MHLVIVHYHLNRGGVTQVIQNHLHALACAEIGQSIDSVTILFGGRRQGWPDKTLDASLPFNLRLVALPELEYDEAPICDPTALTYAMHREITCAGASPERTLLHVHNHSLGKNASLVGAIENLASQGYRFLLQIHDFAEDFRPANYRHLAQSLGRENLAARLYPQSPAIHYAVLNGRDRQLLRTAGVADERLHLVPNPVAEIGEQMPQDAAKGIVSKKLNIDPSQPLLIYPVRGIRRKNIGEMLLLSAISEQPSVLAVTLAPLNPTEAESFQAWRQFSEELRLNCKFDIGSVAGLEFHTILAAADRILTTSVAEGFGMVFLEAWLAGRSLVGRNLPEITADFSAHDISYNAMYDQLRVPLSLVDERKLRDDLTEAYKGACHSFGKAPATDAELALQLDELTSDGTIDFARLSVQLQRQVIATVLRDSVVRNPAAKGPAEKNSAAAQLREANPRLALGMRVDAGESQEIIGKNAKLVRKHFSLKAAGASLVNAYMATLRSDVGGPATPLPHAERILDSFLDIRRLHPVRLT